VSKLEWNQQTGNYEGAYDGQQIAVSGDVMSETKNAMARDLFGQDYADLDDAATNKIDAEAEGALGWDTDEYLVTEDD
jgi:hypothetical protein